MITLSTIGLVGIPTKLTDVHIYQDRGHTAKVNTKKASNLKSFVQCIESINETNEKLTWDVTINRGWRVLKRTQS